MSDRVYISTHNFPLTEEHISYLHSCAVSGERKAELIFRAPKDITAEDLDQAAAFIGFFPPYFLAKARKPEWVQLPSAGADAFTAAGILPEDCVLTNAAGAFSLSVGEHMIAQTFALIRHFPENAADQRDHIWGPVRPSLSIEGATILVLGFGDIGRFYARKMNLLGAHVIGVRRREGEKPDYADKVVTTEHLHEVLPEADILAMVLPGGAATRHVISDREFDMMRKGSYILNAGRGNAIDPAALMRALDSGRIGAAALDVTEPEPLPGNHPLWDYRNVLITPHSAGFWQLEETLNRVVRITGENLRAFSAGTAFTHVVDREHGY